MYNLNAIVPIESVMTELLFINEIIIETEGACPEGKVKSAPG
jgi:hypothetical protein